MPKMLTENQALAIRISTKLFHTGGMPVQALYRLLSQTDPLVERLIYVDVGERVTVDYMNPREPGGEVYSSQEEFFEAYLGPDTSKNPPPKGAGEPWGKVVDGVRWSVREANTRQSVFSGLTEAQANHAVQLRAQFLTSLRYALAGPESLADPQAVHHAWSVDEATRFKDLTGAGAKVLVAALKERRLRALKELPMGGSMLVMAGDLPVIREMVQAGAYSFNYELPLPGQIWVRVSREATEPPIEGGPK